MVTIAITAITATILLIMITVVLHLAHLVEDPQDPQALQALQVTATIKVMAFTMDPQQVHHMAITAMAFTMGLLVVLLVLLVAQVALTTGPKTCHLRMSMQPEALGAPLVITMGLNTGVMDIDLHLGLDMAPECTMAVLLAGLDRMGLDLQANMTPMDRSMVIMGIMALLAGIMDQ